MKSLKVKFIVALLLGFFPFISMLGQANHDLVFQAYQSDNLRFDAQISQPRPAKISAGGTNNRATMDALFITDDRCAIINISVSCPQAGSNAKLKITDGISYSYTVPFSGYSATYYGPIPLSSENSTLISVTVTNTYYP